MLRCSGLLLAALAVIVFLSTPLLAQGQTGHGGNIRHVTGKKNTPIPTDPRSL